MSPRLANRRIRLLLADLCARCSRVTLGRAFWLQVVRAPGSSGSPRSSTTTLVTTPAGRGTIFDRHGRPARDRRAGDRRSTPNPRQVRNPQKVAVAAGPCAQHRPEQDLPAAARPEARLRLRRSARPTRRARPRCSGVGSPGSTSIRRSGATYPQHTVASQVLGYAGVDNTGLAGLELALDRELAGRPGKETIVRDPFGRTIDVVSSTPEQPGRDVFLTLDHTLQAKVESVLRDDGREVARDRRDGDRARSDDRRRAGDGDGARASTRTTSPTCRAGSSATAPSPTRTSPARRSRSSRTRPRSPSRSSRRTRRSRCRRRSRSPTA